MLRPLKRIVVITCCNKLDNAVTMGVTKRMQNAEPNPVKSYRLQAGLKVRELADLWGTSFATLSRIENGTQRIPEKLLPKVSEATGKTPAELRPDLVERSERLSEMLAAEPAQ